MPKEDVNIVNAPVTGVDWLPQGDLQTIFASTVWVSRLGQTLYLVFGEFLPPGADNPNADKLSIRPVARIALPVQDAEAMFQIIQDISNRNEGPENP